MKSIFETTMPFDIMLPNDMFFVPSIIILMLTIFLGMFIMFIGLRKRKFLKKCLRLNAKIEEISYPSFNATVSWDFMGITHYSSTMGVHALTKKDHFHVLYSVSTCKTTFDVWTHNGKGLILGGATICFLSGLALYLLVMFS